MSVFYLLRTVSVLPLDIINYLNYFTLWFRPNSLVLFLLNIKGDTSWVSSLVSLVVPRVVVLRKSGKALKTMPKSVGINIPTSEAASTPIDRIISTRRRETTGNILEDRILWSGAITKRKRNCDQFTTRAASYQAVLYCLQ